MKTLNEITISTVNIPEHVVSVVPEDMLPTFEEIEVQWKRILRVEKEPAATNSLCEWLADDIKDTLSIRGYDISTINDNNFYVKLDHLDKPQSFEETMNLIFP